MLLVTGATGQLGFDVVKELKKRNLPCLGVGSSDFDLTKEEEVKSFLRLHKPSSVIHCAAYTAVDKAETQADLCFAVNGDGTRHLALACKEIGAKLLYISTDYVFSGEGDQPFSVNSPTVPNNIYGKSKLAGEQAVQELLEEYFILRISWVFGEHGNNFVKTMCRLGREKEQLSVVADQIGSPTYTVDLAKLLCDMIATQHYGVYHGSNEGFCSWAEFAREIMIQEGISCQIQGISTQEYPTPATRPHNSRLDKSALVQAGFSLLPPWQEGLRHFLRQGDL